MITGSDFAEGKHYEGFSEQCIVYFYADCSLHTPADVNSTKGVMSKEGQLSRIRKTNSSKSNQHNPTASIFLRGKVLCCIGQGENDHCPLKLARGCSNLAET